MRSVLECMQQGSVRVLAAHWPSAYGGLWVYNVCVLPGQIDCYGQGFKMSPAIIPTWVFPLPIPSPPFFVLLPSVHHSTVQVQQYNTWLISNPAGWNTACRFHFSCQMNQLDNILEKLCAFLAELPHDCPCAAECSVYCNTQSSGKSSEDLCWRVDPQQGSVFVF